MQHQTHGFDARADVYAVAAIVYHLLCGEPAFPERTAAAVLERRVGSRPTPLGAGLGQPAALDRVLGRALSWDPDKRPASAAELADELDLLLDTPRGREWYLPAPAVLLVCLVLGLVAFAATYLWISP